MLTHETIDEVVWHVSHAVLFNMNVDGATFGEARVGFGILHWVMS